MDGALQGAPPCAPRREGRQLPAIAEFDSVGLRYGTGAEVLRDLDFRLADGGFYFLTGPSGAGKTSLLSCSTSRSVRPAAVSGCSARS